MKSHHTTASRRLKQTLSVVLLTALTACALCGCGNQADSAKSGPDTKEKVALTIVGSSPDFKAMEDTIQDFTAVYPNCTITYEYLQDYKNSLEKRLAGDAGSIDLFMTDNIQSDSPLLSYAMDLYTCKDKLDLSDTFQPLLKNFQLLGSDTAQLYAIPLGAEMRGMYVNKTLLEQHGLSVPNNRAALLNACEVLSKQGLIPIQGNPGNFSQLFLFPYITNLIASADDLEATRSRINSCAADADELFEDPMQFLYSLVEKNYYNYKYVENTYGAFQDSSTDTVIKSFLNIESTDAGGEKRDDVGTVAFMPGTISMQSQLEKAIDDYHSNISYEFILSPVSDQGGFAYMSPARGIAVNKNGTHTDWTLAFLDFLFDAEHNKAFAEAYHIIPNTKDAIAYTAKAFGIPENQITNPDDIAFDYGFYALVTAPLVDISKGNNPKYMKKDENGQTVMYDLSYYTEKLKARFTEQRETGKLS